MPLCHIRKVFPTLHETVWLAPTAWVTGDVVLGEGVSVFFAATIRGDIQPIRVGDRSNVQDGAMLHTSRDHPPCIIGNDTTIGHRAIVHGATVGNRCIIGMGATILDGAVIGDECIIGAHTLIPLGMQVPPGSLVIGTPGKVKRALTVDEIADIRVNAQHYIETSREYLGELGRGW